MLTTGSDAIAVVDGDDRIQGVVTVDAVLAWVAAGAGSADQPIAGLLRESLLPRSARRRRSPTPCWRLPRPAPTRWP